MLSEKKRVDGFRLLVDKKLIGKFFCCINKSLGNYFIKHNKTHEGLFVLYFE